VVASYKNTEDGLRSYLFYLEALIPIQYSSAIGSPSHTLPSKTFLRALFSRSLFGYKILLLSTFFQL